MSSLRDRVAARRRERERERSFVLPIPGYEDLGLCARYRPLAFEELHDLQRRHAEDDESAGAILALRADTLARSCIELLERRQDGSYQSLGCGWTAFGVREHLVPELPETATARDAIFAVFNGVTGGQELYWHFGRWDEEASRSAQQLGEEQAGESGPSVTEGS